MKVLLITSSARGHAIAEALARSHRHPEIFSLCTTRNPGIHRIATAQEVLDIMDFSMVLAHAKRWRPDFAIIGPDDPIGAGLADALDEIGIPSVAPFRSLARIESSKGFARELLRKYGIDASPQWRVFSSNLLSRGERIQERGSKEFLYPLSLSLPPRGRELETAIRRFIEDDLHGNYVVKYDALRGGKGVKVSGEHLASVEEGVAYACSCIEQCGQVVIEEKLSGPEFSLMSFVSGKRVVHMPAVQDHKRAFGGDTGPNTGGMGSYSMPNHSMPFLTQRNLARAKEINQLVAEALYRECKAPHPNPLPRGEGIYKGILYGGYMMTPNGMRVIEFNARFGDPEALNVLPLLTSDFATICEAIIHGELTEDIVSFERKATVCKYVVPEGYPENKDQKGEEIVLPPLLLEGERVRVRGCNPLSSSLPSKGERIPRARIFFGDVTEDPDGTLRLGTSRALAILGIGDTLPEAEKIAQHLCEQVQGPVRFRSDIGTTASLQKRIAAMGLRHSLPQPPPAGRGKNVRYFP